MGVINLSWKYDKRLRKKQKFREEGLDGFERD
jgi:hypothetical protein